jgi:hypothetical protein
LDFDACVKKYGCSDAFFSQDPLGKKFEELFGASQYFQSDEDEADELREI